MPTPVPLVDLEGILFFDYNGSGQREDGEPAIGSFGVCVKGKDICVTTDDNGHYVFERIAPEGEGVSLDFVDPNADNPSLAFRYMNLWIKEVVIEAYETNGVQVPEQTLNDTKIRRISAGFRTRAGNSDLIGLSQGYLTHIFGCKDLSRIATFHGNDLDRRAGHVRNYLGDTTISREPGHGKTGDGHNGYDWGNVNDWSVIGIFVRAPAPGIVEFAGVIANENRPLHVTLEYPYFNQGSGQGHFNNVLVEVGQRVYRGQIIATLGKSGTAWPHVHFGFFSQMNPFTDGDPFRDITNPDSVSYWTVDNTPQCLP